MGTYDSRLGFEVADFLYRRDQMSASGINFILSLWAASLAVHGDEPPFSNAHSMYDTIDSTPLGDVPWSSFTLQHNGTQPVDNIHHGWKLSTMCGSGIPIHWSRISSQTPILSLVSITRLTRAHR